MNEEERARIDAIMDLAAKLEDVAAAIRLIRLQLTTEALRQSRGMVDLTERKEVH